MVAIKDLKDVICFPDLGKASKQDYALAVSIMNRRIADTERLITFQEKNAGK